ncbi:hypothetical protein [Streptomyces caelestis]|uniref:hypothetical protein n=1 Tax=Streptomyces caelestis TaxID=36816 RepID=UPI00365C9193
MTVLPGTDSEAFLGRAWSPSMDGDPSFPVEDPQEDGEEPRDFDAAEPAFVEALQNRAASWRVPFAHSDVGRPDDDSSLPVYVSLSDRGRAPILGERAVHVHGARVRAGKVCDQLFTLHETAERGPFRASGTPERLAERCARPPVVGLCGTAPHQADGA